MLRERRYHCRGGRCTKATSGSQSVTEAVALDTASVVLTFGITCNSGTSGLSDKASVDVTENQALAGGAPPPAGSGGGGGALNPLALLFLAGLLALRRVRVESDRGARRYTSVLGRRHSPDGRA